MPKKIVPIKYTDREFNSIKQSLVDYAKRYYPETFRDFSEASFGSLMLDTVAYVGDILSYYVDYQANESFLETALEYDNIIKLGRQLGFKFKGNPSSFGICTFYILCPADFSGSGPDVRYLPILKKKSQFKSLVGSYFTLDENVNFGDPNNEVRVARNDPVTGIPSAYAIKARGRVISGRYSEEFIRVGQYERFKKITLNASNIAEIVSVFDSEGHEYYEVEYLSQDTIYKSVRGENEDILKPFQVARRFITEKDRQKTTLVFGGGYDYETELDLRFNSSFIDPASVVLRRHGTPYITDDSFDPHKLVESDQFGVSPSNTNLQIAYRINSPQDVNALTGTVTNVVSPIFEFKNRNLLVTTEMNAVMRSLECINEEPILGDVKLPTSEELKRRIIDNFSTQNRAVTSKDYEAITYAMPSNFGSIKRCKLYRDTDSLKRNLNLYVISESKNYSLESTNDTIKNNIKTWLNKNKMVNDTIDILNAKIINLAINFEILAHQEKESIEVLQSCVSALKRYYAKHPEIGEPFFITDIYKILNDVEGVVDTKNVNISLRSGGDYSDIRFNVRANTSPDGRYIEIPKNCIWEIKFLNQDINGVVR